jgi:triose/dihydroxyacetone kinase / FAD-AMP lyase (cyclizing)
LNKSIFASFERAFGTNHNSKRPYLLLRNCCIKPAMKSFINRPEDLVTESISGLVATTPHLSHLDGFPGIKVVLDTTHNGEEHVAVIAGGGSGHEPAFAGYVGSGMLAAAVAGDVFASPSEEAVLAAIRAVTGSKGCLVIVNNYTGDRLQFGGAVERAKAEGLHVDLALVADDCALPEATAVGRRGIAGMVLVLKLAGAAAAAGKELVDVCDVACKAASAVCTLGCSLTTCTLPGKESSTRLGADEMEIGLGIHGEPGALKTKVKPVDAIIQDLIHRIVSAISRNGASHDRFSVGSATAAAAAASDKNIVRDDDAPETVFKSSDRMALLVNNLGSSTPLEMGAATHAAIAATRKLGCCLSRVYTGTFMTSLDMHGLSVSLLRLPAGARGDGWLQALDACTDAPAWPKHAGRYDAGKAAVPVPTGTAITGRQIEQAALGDSTPENAQSMDTPEAETLRRCVVKACQALLHAEEELDALDRAVGDGDCGSTLARGAIAVMEEATSGRLPCKDPGATALAIADAVGKSVGGTSGALLKIFFAAAGGCLKSPLHAAGRALTIDSSGAAFIAGTAAVSKYGGAHAGDRTMLDALLAAQKAFEDRRTTMVGGTPTTIASGKEVAMEVAKAAAEGAEATKYMQARAGRSTYVPAEALKGVPDPGAVAMARWLDSVAKELGK